MPNGTRPVPCSVVVPAVDGNGYGDVLQLSPAEPYNSHGAAATHHYDSEDPSSEDGEEYEDFLPHEPFPSESVALISVLHTEEKSKRLPYGTRIQH